LEFWDALRQWQHAIGALIGFLALAAAALFNAHLSRRRDDRLQEAESDLLARSLKAEVKGIVSQLQSVQRFNESTQVKTPLDAARKLKSITILTPTIYPQVVMKIGLLAPEVAEIVTNFYGILAGLEHSLDVRMPDLEPVRGEEGWFTIAGAENIELALHKADRTIPTLIELGDRAVKQLEMLAAN